MANSRILIRSGKAPHVALSQEAAFARKRAGSYAGNAGNLLFTNAVYRLLNTAASDVVSDSLTTERKGVTRSHIDRINNEFDHFVLPLANSLRPSFKDGLARLTTVIEKLKIPVTVVGVGAQLPRSGDWTAISDDVHSGVKRFASAVLDRSASIGVRGEITSNYLRWLGFNDDQIDVIGCPSMFDNGRAPEVSKATNTLDISSRLAINVDHRVPNSHRALSLNYEQYDDVIFVSQNQAEAGLLMWGNEIKDYPKALPGDIHHPIYAEGRIRFFQDPAPWIEFMKSRDFVFGTRLHGTIAGLLAGTPSILLTHDSRTQELADYHQLPHLPIAQNLDFLRAEDLYERTDLAPLNEARSQNFDRYISFIEKNRLSHIYTPGNENPEYEDTLRNVDFSPPLEPLTTSPPDIIASRLRWVWQGIDVDQQRAHGAYEPPFSPSGLEPRSAFDLTKSLSREIKISEKSHSKEIRRAHQRIDELTKMVRLQAEVINYLKTPIEKRLVRGVQKRAALVKKRIFRRNSS